MNPSFWNERFGGSSYFYGTAPNAFLARERDRLAPGAFVVDLGTGEGRTAVFFAEQGFNVTAVDYAQAGLDKVARLAEERGVAVETVCADLRTWQPARQWDAVLIAFLHLPPQDRPAFYQLVRKILRPGGWLLAEWFRPEQITEGYTSGGPKSAEMMVTRGELAAHFSAAGIVLVEEPTVWLDEGSGHRGPAAVVRLIWRKPASSRGAVP